MSRLHVHRVATRGQVTPLIALVLAVALVVALGVGQVGRRIVERHGATVAADAAALASIQEPPMHSVIETYRQSGFDVQARGGASMVRIGAVEARSQAVVDRTVTVAPAVIAIVARAEQLLGESLDPVSFDGTTVELSPRAASRFLMVAPELQMCEVVAPDPSSRRFSLCSAP